ncbi:ketoacyl-ACP synthase III family protein [Amycolatopsis nigrescens]|uniref:ketoacyl-ACP synthase III family protein n=1 Tax=Amycolatopsis nigrescens TaxID=381445 RepID=UPI00038171C8|nr:ketoacyl-ACP synthase III family protein [Amycolatopsis nigrescens]
MRLPNVYIAGTGRRLPPAMTIEEAERAGLCDRRTIWRTRIESVCVSEHESAPELAARAARIALRQAGSQPDEIDLILHASIYYQGHDLWTPASYIQRVAVGNACPAIEVAQMSNGGLAALELAAGYLLADPAHNQALVTTGDRFCAPGIDRWRSDPGTVLADGGTAAVLSTRDGFARLRSLATVSDPSLERMQRGNARFGDAPYSSGEPVDVDAHRRGFVSETGLDTVLDRFEAGQRAAVKQALSDAGLELGEIDWFVLPNLGKPRLDEQFLRKFEVDLDRTTWSWGHRVGHLGAGDQIAGFGHLADSGALLPGQRCLLVSVGAGFTWSCAVVEMLRRPESVPVDETVPPQ